MRVVVLGSGVIGVTTAWYLARSGHEVAVVERQPGAALETSHANAGQISPGYSAPWAAPGIPFKAVKWLLQKHSPLVVRPGLDPALWVWVARMLRNCTAARYAVNKERMLRLALYSRRAFDEIRSETGIHYDERALGTLQLFRTRAQVDAAARDIAVLDSCGVAYELLDAAGCAAAEPALARVREKIAGGLRLPGDATGDCYRFTVELARRAAAAGVEFRYGVDILGLEHDGARVTGVHTAGGVIRGDAFVAALGSHTPALLRPLGLRLPIYPVKGYSITVPVTDPDGAPISTVMDETHKVAITRLGDRIRAAGTAELAGFDLRLRPARREMLVRVVGDLYPDGGDLGAPEFWAGLRPMTPDGTPVIGPTAYRNLYLNTGHGTLGWTMSCGSGKLLADLVAGRAPAIALDGLTLARYGR